MIQMVATVHTDIVQSVFAKVSLAVSVSAQPGAGLYKDSASPVMAAASEVWEKVRDLLNHAASKGWEAAQTMADEVNAFIENIAGELKEQADEFRALLLEKLRELVRETFDFVLRSIRSQIQVGDSFYMLNSIELESKLVYSSSIEASVTALCKFVGKGESVVTGTYSLMKPEEKP